MIGKKQTDIGESDMIESVAIIKEKRDIVVKRYSTISQGKVSCKNNCIESDGIIFKELNDWSMLIMNLGEPFAEEFLLNIAEGQKLVYYYYDDSQLDCEFIVIQDNKIIRKRFIYSDTPELNEDIGELRCEDRKFENWNDIDYLVEKIQESPNSIF